MNEEEKEFSYPRVQFTRSKIVEDDVEVVKMSMFSIVKDSQTGEEHELEFNGYYPYEGEIDIHNEYGLSHIFHKLCMITYITGMPPEEGEYDVNDFDPDSIDIDNIDLDDDERLE